MYKKIALLFCICASINYSVWAAPTQVKPIDAGNGINVITIPCGSSSPVSGTVFLRQCASGSTQTEAQTNLTEVTKSGGWSTDNFGCNVNTCPGKYSSDKAGCKESYSPGTPPSNVVLSCSEDLERGTWSCCRTSESNGGTISCSACQKTKPIASEETAKVGAY
jgi:hypothetical protein